MLSDHEIYSDFREEVKCLGNRHKHELGFFPKEILALARHYHTKRLMILNDIVEFDPRLGRPVPYLAYWFADALGLKEKETVRQLGASLMYISLCVSIRDDLQDGRTPVAGKLLPEHAYVCLANIYYSKYFYIFKRIFPAESEFWHVLSSCLNGWSEYESWSFIFNRDNDINPLSDSFLRKSSRYLVAITLPTFAAAAMLTKNHAKIPQISRFLEHYCMGWKIVDDIRDWQKDLQVRNYNHSSVLNYCMKKLGTTRLNRGDVTSVLSGENASRDIYNTIVRLYGIAKRDVQSFDSSYLARFMDTQIEFHMEEKNNLHVLREEFNTNIGNILTKHFSDAS